MVNNSYKAYFKSNSRDTNSVMFVNNGYSFTMNIATSQVTWYSSALNAIIGMQQPMNPQNTVAAITNEVITYSGAWINTDLQYQVYGDSLKETLIIHAVSPPTSPIYADYLQYAANCYYDSSLTIYANGVGYLHPTNQRFTTTGSICFNDNQNATVFSVPPPTIHDSSGSYITGVYGVTANNGIIIINIRFPKVFLDSAVYPVYLDPSLYEYYNVNQDDYDYFYDNIWDAQTFAVGATGHTITSVKLMMFRVGSPGILTVHIRNSSDGAKPNGADLTTGTYNANDLGTSSVGAWIEVTVSEITLDASTSYAICCSCTGADINNRVCWKDDSSSPSYGDGEYSQSDDAGTNWYPTTDYDMMFEVYGNSLGSIPYEDYIDNDTSDVDSTADIGASSAFANQKATDSTYDTLTEADNDAGTSQWGDTSGSGSSYRTTAANEVRLYSYTATSTGEVASIVFYGRGVSATNAKAIITDSSGNLLTNGVGAATAVSSTAGTKTLTYTAGSRPVVVSGTTYWIGVIGEAALRIYYDSTTGSTSKQDTTNSYASPTSPTDAGSTTETWRLMYTNINNLNYRLSYEEQFTDVNYTRTAEYLCIKTGAYSNGEALKVSYRNGGSWTLISASLTASAWNNFTVTLTTDTYTILFEDGTQTNDAVQSNWQIDAVLLHTWDVALYNGDVVLTISYACSTTRVYAASRSASKSVSFSGSASKALEMLKAASKSLTFVGSTARIQEIYKSATKSLSFTGSAAKIFESVKAASQAIGYAASAAKALILSKAVSLSVSFTDTAVRLGEWVRSASQALSYSSVVSALREVARSVSQSLSLASASSRMMESIRSAAQSVSFGSLASRGYETIVSAVQDLTASFSSSRIFESIRSAAQSISFSGLSSRLFEATRNTVQSISSAFTGLNINEYIKSVGQNVSTTFSTGRLFESFRNTIQNITVSGISNRLQEVTVNVTQMVMTGFSALAEFMAASVEYFRDVSQSLGLTSGVGRLIEIAKSVSQSLNFGVLGYKIQEFIASTSLGIILLIHVTNLEPAFGGIPPMFVILVGFMVILVLIVRRR